MELYICSAKISKLAIINTTLCSEMGHKNYFLASNSRHQFLLDCLKISQLLQDIKSKVRWRKNYRELHYFLTIELMDPKKYKTTAYQHQLRLSIQRKVCGDKFSLIVFSEILIFHFNAAIRKKTQVEDFNALFFSESHCFCYEFCNESDGFFGLGVVFLQTNFDFYF